MNRPLPEVEVVDMRHELDNGNRSIFSSALAAALKQCMERGEQAMLLMNRRGYNSFISCRACGHVMKCPHCDVAMTYHVSGGDGMLHCHYCGYQVAPPQKCPKCGSSYIRYFGAGTQKVEEELHKLLPGVPVVRMDIDTTSGKDGHEKLLDEFRSGRAKVLVGTQMIAKGLDFPRVTLVGVIAADMTLNLPDYRARERTFQLLTQVAGRAGRGDTPGMYYPDLQARGSHHSGRRPAGLPCLFRGGIHLRRTGLYPPFTLMARLLVESASEEKALQRATALYQTCQQMLRSTPSGKSTCFYFAWTRLP